jgi:hypothetical protein
MLLLPTRVRVEEKAFMLLLLYHQLTNTHGILVTDMNLEAEQSPMSPSDYWTTNMHYIYWMRAYQPTGCTVTCCNFLKKCTWYVCTR